MIPRPLLALAALLAATAGRAQDKSPFEAPAAPATAAGPAAANENLELTAINVVGPKTYVSIFDKAAKTSRWLAVGATEKDLTVVNCDLVRDEATIKTGGETKRLKLRSRNVASGGSSAALIGGTAPIPGGSPMVVAAQLPPPVYAKPGTVAHQEQEARMLVSDLLEIGMQQRKAYEEAQRKAAEKK